MLERNSKRPRRGEGDRDREQKSAKRAGYVSRVCRVLDGDVVARVMCV